MKTKLLILMRHGAFNPETGDLTTEGEGDVRSVAAQVARLITGNSIALFHSLSKRGTQTAGHVSAALGGVNCVPHECFGREQIGQLADKDAMMKVLESLDADAVVVVTHGEHILELLTPLSRLMGRLINAPPIIHPASALVFNLTAKQFSMLVPR
jgi:phosphohistidine phosphatase SixA